MSTEPNTPELPKQGIARAVKPIRDSTNLVIRMGEVQQMYLANAQA
jgi:hypothetical protein